MITFSSDFGTADPYVAIVKGVILSINPRAQIVDLSHELAAHDVRRAAFFVVSACPVFPKRTIHLGVVDPGVGSRRKSILLETEKGFFVGPDNGLFSLVWQNSSERKAYWLKNEKYFFKGTSHTFAARDIFGPVAAYLSLGIAPDAFGPKLGRIALAGFPKPANKGSSKGRRKFLGEIIYIDHFGNLVTNFPYELLAGKKRIEVKLGKRIMRGLAKSYSEIPKGKSAPILGSLGYLEIAANAASAKKLLNAATGSKVELILQ